MEYFWIGLLLGIYIIIAIITCLVIIFSGFLGGNESFISTLTKGFLGGIFWVVYIPLTITHRK
jgi:hypothetical protein